VEKWVRGYGLALCESPCGTYTPEKPVQVIVRGFFPAQLRGLFAHRTCETGSHGWALTHGPSGKTVLDRLGLLELRYVVRTLAKAKLDWTQSEEALAREGVATIAVVQLRREFN
jgi:hypothetical protein